VLGPGVRATIWVQGCPLRCAGCLAPEALPVEGGTQITVDVLAKRILALEPPVDGVTYSGGEPFAQAPGLLALSDRLRAERANLSLMSFTGFTRRWIVARGNAAQRGLLSRLDLLVDGPYVAAQHASLRWRGSANQEVHHLTERHDVADVSPDQSAGVEIQIREDASVGFVGVPPTAGFREAIASSITEAGLTLT
jgi:anaerobic ribonucleoside-triphosphate reductase activating protein